jgi:hypothetical protein
MNDPMTLSSIVLASTAIVALVLKLLHGMRTEIKSCGCLQFRTPDNTERNNTPPRITTQIPPTPSTTPTTYTPPTIPTLNTIPLDEAYKFPPV